MNSDLLQKSAQELYFWYSTEKKSINLNLEQEAAVLFSILQL